MTRSIVGPEITQLIQLFSKLPGLGPRSARRVVLHLVRKRYVLLEPLAEAVRVAAEKIVVCDVCGNIDVTVPCTLCQDPGRDSSILIIVETVSDVWALERASALRASYHVLGGVLSPLDGVRPQDLNIDGLRRRLLTGKVKEVVMALNATVSGQTTMHYLIEQIQDYDVVVTRLAHGVPIGGDLDYLDEGTIVAALTRRSAC